MARYTVDFTEEHGAEVNLGPGVLVPKGMELSFEANSEDELRALVGVLGFDAAGLDPTKDLHVRYGVPLVRDGEEVASVTLHLWIGDGLVARRHVPSIAAVEAVRDEARARKTQEEVHRGRTGE